MGEQKNYLPPGAAYASYATVQTPLLISKQQFYRIRILEVLTVYKNSASPVHFSEMPAK